MDKEHCGRVFTDKMSGKRFDRPEFLKMLEMARTGDVIVVWRLDRLGRSLKQLIETVTMLGDRGIELRSLKENIDTTTSTGKLMFHIVAAMAEAAPRNVDAPLLPEELPRIDATLVTHSHYDHYDRPSVNAAKARVICGTGLGREIDVPSSELAWWDTERINDQVRVTFVPSQHWSRRGLFDANETLWGGFVIEGSKARIYHAGDTAYFEGFTEIGKRFPEIDTALLPIGAYDPAWFMEKQHMNPVQAVQAFVDLRARNFVAMHWGTFKLTDEPLDEPPRLLRAEWERRGLPPAALHIPAVGATL